MIALANFRSAMRRAFCVKCINPSSAVGQGNLGSILCRLAIVGVVLPLSACGGGGENAEPDPSPSNSSTHYILNVTTSGSGTVTSDPAGVACGGDCNESYAGNTAITLTAVAATGSVFSGWSGDCAGTNLSCTVTMSAARNVIALFGASTPLSIKLNVDAAAATTPVTFGHAFAKGDVAADAGLALRTPAGQLIPVQIDNKATSDNTLRYGILSAILPANAGGAFELVATAPLGTHTPRDVAELLSSGFDAVVTLKTSDGRTLTASARTLFQNKVTRWLDGPIATEWETGGAIGNDPHLAVRFNVRSYAGVAGERVDVVIENDSTVIESPRVFTTSNVTYDVDISIRGTSVYTQTGLVHYRQARWRKVFSSFTDLAPRYDVAYLKKTGAVPNYDPTVVVSETALARWGTRAQVVEPMKNGMIYASMPGVGGREDLGILPAWSAAYVISMDPRARQAVLAVGTSASSFPIHFRDKNTDRPISLTTYPDLTIYGNSGDTKHPFPACSGDCTNPTPALQPDTPHQPSMAYLPYLITGDHFYLEELEFWADWNIFAYNPAYRHYALGILDHDEVRGKAWNLRTLGQVSFIAPDSDSFKNYFATMLANNLDWFPLNQAGGNNLGIINSGLEYLGGRGYAPWQDDFFTSAVNEVHAMGFDNAATLLAFKASSPVKRMLDMCWITSGAYALAVRPSTTGALFQNFGEVADATYGQNADGSRFVNQPCATQQMADWLNQHYREAGNTTSYKAGEIVGNATDPESYTATLQAALAAAVDAKVDRANDAWSLFAKRPIKQNYSSEPQFAIVPR
ncbi:MAG: hypothetical protein HY308_17565 [Gammaproteobacteria bacterium]|nr:hypothetical protein [Gammaproteobacteria bacterium]